MSEYTGKKYLLRAVRKPGLAGTRCRIGTVDDNVDYKNSIFYLFYVTENVNDYVINKKDDHILTVDIEKLKDTISPFNGKYKDFLENDEFNGTPLDTTTQEDSLIVEHIITDEINIPEDENG